MDSRITQLEQLIKEGAEFTFRNFSYQRPGHEGFGGADTPAWLAWKTRVFNVAGAIGSEESPALRLAKKALSINTEGHYPDRFARAHNCLKKALDLLLAAVNDDAFGELRQPRAESVLPTISNKVFVVHGHDSGLKAEIEQFLSHIGLEAVVLHRQPDQGQTIIEKFEKYSDVGYAIILLTPDEVAYTVDQGVLPAEERTTEMRARPNVIFEFGYFVGKLGRGRVCCIYKGEVVLPSDLHGLVYKKVDSSFESQAFGLMRELKTAGYQITI